MQCVLDVTAGVIVPERLRRPSHSPRVLIQSYDAWSCRMEKRYQQVEKQEALSKGYGVGVSLSSATECFCHWIDSRLRLTSEFLVVLDSLLSSC